MKITSILKKVKAILVLGVVLSFIGSNTLAQNVGIGTTTPDASSILELNSTTLGFLVPRMTAVQKTAIGTPATGLLIYQTDAPAGFWYYDGTAWTQIGGDAWKLTGNTGTTPGTGAGQNFIGTTDAQDWIMATNGTQRMRITSGGQVTVNNAGLPIAGDVFSSYAAGTDFAISGYSTSGTGVGVLGGTVGTGNASYFYTANASNASATIFAWNINGTGNGLIVDHDGTGRGIEVQMAAANTGIGVATFHDGDARMANFQSNNTTTTGGFFYISSASPNTRTLNVQNSSTTTTNQVGFFSQASTGTATATYQNAAAVWAQSAGIRAGVFLATGASSNSIGVNAQSTAAGNYDSYGVLGLSNGNTNWGYGVVGQGNYYGVYSSGDFTATGTKAFTIDHPLDPENKFLKHFSMESDEVLNLYRGNAVLNASGEATVELPNYFHSVNKEFSYQLTPIGSNANLFIKSEINSDAKFVIAGGAPGQKVSWTVYAQRNDKYLQQNPNKMQTEVAKKPNEVGKYVMPELYGKPENLGMFYHLKQQKQQTESTIQQSNSETKSLNIPQE